MGMANEMEGRLIDEEVEDDEEDDDDDEGEGLWVAMDAGRSLWSLGNDDSDDDISANDMCAM